MCKNLKISQRLHLSTRHTSVSKNNIKKSLMICFCFDLIQYSRFCASNVFKMRYYLKKEKKKTVQRLPKELVLLVLVNNIEKLTVIYPLIFYSLTTLSIN